MNELTALKWLEQQAGLRVIIKKDRRIILTDGMTVEVTGTGILDAVVNLQKTLRELENNGT